MIVNRLAEIMAEQGVSVSALARGACISRGAAHKLFHGRNDGISLDVLDKVCGFLEVQIGDVLVYAPEGSEARRLEEAREAERHGQRQLLDAMQALLAIDATELRGALDRASELVAEAMEADAVDCLIYDPSTETLISLGVSDSPLAGRERQLGLDRAPLANGGRTVDVFRTGTSYVTGCAEREPSVPAGLTSRLGIRSFAAVSLDVAGERRGVLRAIAARPDAFSLEELQFLEAVARWVGMVAHRAELVERLTRDAVRQATRAASEGLTVAFAQTLGKHVAPLQLRIDSVRRRAEGEGRRSELKDAEAASAEIGRLREMGTELLEIGRLDEGTMTLRRRTTDLAALTREIAGEPARAGCAVRVRAPKDLVVQADPELMRRALRHILAAVSRNTPVGLPLAVQVDSQAARDGTWAVITVRDERPGVQAGLSAADALGGRPGIGLYAARAIAEAHGGALEIEWRAEEGLIFRLRLPLVPHSPTG